MSGTLSARHSLGTDDAARGQVQVAAAIPTKYRGDPHEGTDTLVAHTLRSEGADASEDGTGRGTPLVCQTLTVGGRDKGAGDSYDNTPITVGFQQDVFCDPDGYAPTLAHSSNSHMGHHQPKILAFDTTQITSKLNRSSPKPGDPCHPIAAGAHAPAVTTAIPRRLTPRECERLQGWPDDWARYGRKPDGTVVELSDSARYRMAGNGVSAPVAEWIARRIVGAA